MFKIFFISIVLLLASVSIFAKETLVFAVDVVRHGDRTPQITIPKSPYKWQEGLNQLTSVGMQQEFQLGVAFRKKYVDSCHLLPKSYRSDAMRVYSTDTDRTLMSAQSLLLGLYPLGSGPTLLDGKPSLPKRFQPIPIRVKGWAKKDEDVKRCVLRFEQHLKSDQKLKKEIIRAKNKFKKWSQATGIEITEIFQVVELSDALLVYKTHNAPMPPKLTNEDIKEIMEIGERGRISLSANKELATHCYSRPSLIDIVGYLKDASLQKKPLKYVLFFSHNSVIGAILALLENPINKSPPYASYLSFSLFKTNAENHIVKVSYDGEQLNIPGCGTKVCTLGKFVKLVVNQ